MPEVRNKRSRIVYLMRGLPGCGKSHRARRLAGDGGVVLETDQYFYSQVGDDPARYDYDRQLLKTAQDWNFNRFRVASRQGVSPIVIDRGTGFNAETRRYAQHALDHGYRVELAEPDSPWWLELRVLLKYKDSVDDALFDEWAEKLAHATQKSHRVPALVIRRWMAAWRYDITVDQIVNSDPR